jgi:hypothetical protein
MHFQNIAILALAGLGAANRWPGVEHLPDGPYQGVVHANGSTTMTSLDSGSEHFFELEQAPASELQKRYTSCWGDDLPHGGVDGAGDSLKRWAGSGQELSSGDSGHYYGFNNQGVYVYYCINWPHSRGNLDTNDVYYAFGQMDANCRAYEAGYFQWDNTPEIVGKCRSGTAVCLG